MKKYIILLLLISFAACKKGDTGAPGNANVKQYTFGPHNFNTTVVKNLSVKITKDSADACAWFVYIQSSDPFDFMLPGYGFGGATYYRLIAGYDSDNTYNISVVRLTGPGEAYKSFKVVRIYINDKVVDGGRRASPLPDIDFSDYAAVKKYYNLPD